MILGCCNYFNTSTYFNANFKLFPYLLFLFITFIVFIDIFFIAQVLPSILDIALQHTPDAPCPIYAYNWQFFISFLRTFKSYFYIIFYYYSKSVKIIQSVSIILVILLKLIFLILKSVPMLAESISLARLIYNFHLRLVNNFICQFYNIKLVARLFSSLSFILRPISMLRDHFAMLLLWLAI